MSGYAPSVPFHRWINNCNDQYKINTSIYLKKKFCVGSVTFKNIKTKHFCEQHVYIQKNNNNFI